MLFLLDCRDVLFATANPDMADFEVAHRVGLRQLSFGTIICPNALIKQEKKAGLRISVLPGGCSGYQYGMELDDNSTEDDIVVEQGGIKIFIDKESIKKLNGSNVDYIDSLQGAGFKIDNPNATKTCGCGNSFG